VTSPGRRIRILWVTKGLGPGGTERLLVEHASAGDRQSFEYEAAYLLPWKDHLVPELTKLDVATHCLDVRSPVDVRWLPRLDHLVRRGRFDVVHLHSPSVAAAARPLIKARPHRHPPALVYTEHNRWSSYKATTRALNRATYCMNDATIAVSDDVRASITPALQPRVEVVTHGVDPSRVRATRADRRAVRDELGVEPGEVLAVTIANLRTQKNYPGLLAAAQATLDRGVAVRFAAAGQGPLEAEVREAHAARGLGDRFQLLGYRDDVTRLIGGADVFVLASHHEGLPVSVMEALVLGVPVIAPAVGGLREAVTDGESGVLVVPDDPVALADAIVRVATDHELRARLAAGAEREGTRFSSVGPVARVEEIYRAVSP
jgi:glycosyltransferase involved in cell wall biosynthesis